LTIAARAGFRQEVKADTGQGLACNAQAGFIGNIAKVAISDSSTLTENEESIQTVISVSQPEAGSHATHQVFQIFRYLQQIAALFQKFGAGPGKHHFPSLPFEYLHTPDPAPI